MLPVDTNVRRVQERTGEAFDADCAQALFDLGATVCLARIPRCGDCPLAGVCPSRGRRYEPLRRQSPFEGSFRQRRALALRAVAAGADPDDDEALAALARDGLVTVAATAGGAADPHRRRRRPEQRVASAPLEQRDGLGREPLAAAREAEPVGGRRPDVHLALADRASAGARASPPGAARSAAPRRPGRSRR